jgi:hypothetical protein
MIPNVVPGQVVRASEQNALIDQVNKNTTDITKIQASDLEAVTELIGDAVAEHVASPTPHPQYDDIPSLKILFENGLI